MRIFARQNLLPTLLCGVAALPLPAFSDQFDCLIEPSAVASIVAADKGVIAEVPVERGDYVREGDVLVLLDNDVQRMQVDLNRIQAQSDVEIRSAETRLSLRQQEFDRATGLASRQATAQARVDEARIELSLTQLSLEQAQIARKVAEVQLAQAEAFLERRTVRSRMNGVVLSVDAVAGEYANEQVELLSVAQIDPLHVRVFLPIAYYQAFSTQESFTIHQSLPVARDMEVRPKTIDKVFDVASGTFGAVLELPNPDLDIPAGTRCKLDFTPPTR